jgi:hypothetical protein
MGATTLQRKTMTLTYQEQEINKIAGRIAIRGEKYLRSDGSHAFQVLQPIFRQAYLESLRMRKGQYVSTNLVEMSLYASLAPFLADYSDTTIYFNEIPGELGKALTRVAEDRFATNIIVVNSQLIDRLEVHRFPEFKIIRYLGELHAFELNTERCNASIENEGAITKTKNK